MQLLGRLEIKSEQKIKEFLDIEHVGRIASIDKDGYPQIIPMNFVFLNDAIYLHSHTKGEKLDNIRRNHKVGFEVDRELEFLPSYFEDPNDASLADTLYISVVIKGTASVIFEKKEMTLALNGLMRKYLLIQFAVNTKLVKIYAKRKELTLQKKLMIEILLQPKKL